MNHWIALILAIVFETIGTTMLKYSEQFTRPLPTIAAIAGYLLSLYLLSLALRTIPVAIAYAIWGAVGMVLIMLIGMIAFKQIPDLPAIIGILLIQAGILVINFFSKMEAH